MWTHPSESEKHWSIEKTEDPHLDSKWCLNCWLNNPVLVLSQEPGKRSFFLQATNKKAPLIKTHQDAFSAEVLLSTEPSQQCAPVIHPHPILISANIFIIIYTRHDEYWLMFTKSSIKDKRFLRESHFYIYKRKRTCTDTSACFVLLRLFPLLHMLYTCICQWLSTFLML